MTMNRIIARRFLAILLYCGLMGHLEASDVLRFDLYVANARVFVGDGTILERASVGIADGRIQWIGTEDTNRTDARIVINGAGTTIIPGLIDAHVHLMSSEYLIDDDSLHSYKTVILPHWLNGMLLHGVTTIRTLGAPIRESLEIKEKVAEGLIDGPRIVASGPGLTSPQGHPAATMYQQYPDLKKRFVRVATNAKEARAAITEVVEAGMESPLKLVFHGGEPGGATYKIMGIPALRLAPVALEAAIDEAHSQGYRVAVHTNDYEDALVAVLAGVDGLEHGVISAPIPDERLLRAMLKHNTFLVSTLRLQRLLHGSAVQQVAMANLKLLHHGGVTVVVGSDTPVGWTYPGLNTILEIEALVAAGLTPSTAIQAATHNAAVNIELEDQVGRIHEGLFADMVIIKGDPTTDISLLRYPAYVIKNGKLVRGNE